MILNILAVSLIALLLTIFHGSEHLPIINWISMGFIGLGIAFFFGTTIGLLRFPDFYTRMHAAGKGDTLSSILILVGCALYTMAHGHLDMALMLVGIKLLIIINFIFIGSPTATHAMMDAGYEIEIDHWKKRKAKR